MMMHGRRGQQAGNGGMLRVDPAIAEDQDRGAVLDLLLCLFA
jgi:hypothetical protein